MGLKEGSSAVAEQQQRQQANATVQFDDVGGGRDGVSAVRWCDGKLPATAANVAAALVAVAITWCLLYVNTTPELMTPPTGSLASIFVLYVTATVAGQLITRVGGLPPLLGMMLAGIALRNTGLYNVTGWCAHLVSTMR